MRLIARLQRLERHYEADGPCDICGGFGRFVVLLGPAAQEPLLEGCPGCGRRRVIGVRKHPQELPQCN